jgi:hypothetical protein
MKQTFLFIILSVSFLSYSQNSFNNKLLVKYNIEYLQSLSETQIKQLEYELTNSYFIIDNFEKSESFPELLKINTQTKEIINEPLTSVDLTNFNVLKYNYQKQYNNRTYYKIGNTGKTIVFYSVKEFSENYNSVK